MAVDSGRELASIQYLRGIAAMMVVLFHADHQLAKMDAQIGLIALRSGVDIFFVISGFVMWVSTSRSPERTAVQFMRDRIIRIVPLYWAVTFFVASVAFLVPTAMQSTRFDPPLILASLFFIAWPNQTMGGYAPLVIAGWTLNLEMFFYTLFTLAMLVTRNRTSRFVLLVGMIVLACGAATLLPGLPPQVRFYGDDVILEFAFGLGLGWVWLNAPARTSALWWIVCLAGFALLSPGSQLTELPRALTFGVPALMIVAGAIFAPAFRFPALHFLGDSSYSLYLTHAIVLSLVSQVVRRVLPEHLQPFVFVPLAIAASVFAAWIAYRLFERPVTRLAKQLLGGGTAKAQQALVEARPEGQSS